MTTALVENFENFIRRLAGPVLLPGEVEARTKDERLRDGIPVSPGVLASIYAVTDPLAVPRPAPAE